MHEEKGLFNKIREIISSEVVDVGRPPQSPSEIKAIEETHKRHKEAAAEKERQRLCGGVEATEPVYADTAIDDECYICGQKGHNQYNCDKVYDKWPVREGGRGI